MYALSNYIVRFLKDYICCVEASKEVLSGLLEEPPDFILCSARMYPDIYKNVFRHINESATTNFAEYQT